jgi:hypothetical protein
MTKGPDCARTMIDDIDIEEAHKHSIRNRDALRTRAVCGRSCCTDTFD